MPSSKKSAEDKPDTQKDNNNTGGRRYNRSRSNKIQPFYYQAKFKGETEDLHGHIYDVGVQNQAELFSNSTKKIASYAGRK